MPRRVDQLERIISHIRKPVPISRVPWLGHEGIRLDEATQARVIPARAVEVQPQRPLLALTGEALRRGRGPAGVARRAEGVVAQFAGRDCARGGDEQIGFTLAGLTPL